MKILFDEADFEALVSGEILKKEGMQIALQDIGYLRMIDILERKLEELNLTK